MSRKVTSSYIWRLSFNYHKLLLIRQSACKDLASLFLRAKFGKTTIKDNLF